MRDLSSMPVWLVNMASSEEPSVMRKMTKTFEKHDIYFFKRNHTRGKTENSLVSFTDDFDQFVH